MDEETEAQCGSVTGPSIRVEIQTQSAWLAPEALLLASVLSCLFI